MLHNSHALIMQGASSITLVVKTCMALSLKSHMAILLIPDGFGGLVVSMLASGSRVRGFDPDRSRKKILSM
jgi:hypothetical protein